MNLNLALPPNQLHLICGRSGIGKTHFMFQLLDRFRDELGPIAYIGTDRIQEQYDELFVRGSIEPWPTVSLIDAQSRELEKGTVDIGYARALDKIIKSLEQPNKNFKLIDTWLEKFDPKPRTLILDVAQRFVPCKNLNMSNSVCDGLGLMASWAKFHKIRVILVWHPSKTKISELNDPFDCIANSASVQGCVTTKAILLKDDEPGRFTLRVRTTHMDDFDLPLIKMGDGFFRVKDERENTAVAYPLYNLVPTNGMIGRKELLAISSSTPGCPNTERTLYNHLDILIEKGLLFKPRPGFYQARALIQD